MDTKELEAQNAALKAKLDEALKAVKSSEGVDVTGLTKNRDDILNESKKKDAKIKALTDAQDATKAEALKEKGQFKELYEKEQATTAKLTGTIDDMKKEKSLMKAMSKHGVHADFMPMVSGKVEYTETFDVKDVDAVFDGIKNEHPQIFGDQKPIVPDSDTTKAKILGTPAGQFTMEQVKDPEFFAKNKDTILKDFTAGKIKE
jgi:hypothetical protein